MPYSMQASQNKRYSTPPSIVGSEYFVADWPCSNDSHICNRTVENTPLENTRKYQTYNTKSTNSIHYSIYRATAVSLSLSYTCYIPPNCTWLTSRRKSGRDWKGRVELRPRLMPFLLIEAYRVQHLFQPRLQPSAVRALCSPSSAKTCTAPGCQLSSLCNGFL